MPESIIRQLLADLRGGGFNASLLINGVVLAGQKVVTLQDGVVFTVDNAGTANATRIDRTDSVAF